MSIEGGHLRCAVLLAIKIFLMVDQGEGNPAFAEQRAGVAYAIHERTFGCLIDLGAALLLCIRKTGMRIDIER
jgi:hypothetical protein